MQIFFIGPFLLCSAIIGLICLAIPRLRPYALRATIAPIAFGICSFVGLGVIVLIADRFGALNEPAEGAKGIAMLLLLLVVPGIAGAWVAVRVVTYLQGRFSKR
jgi:hypothetical protein